MKDFLTTCLNYMDFPVMALILNESYSAAMNQPCIKLKNKNINFGLFRRCKRVTQLTYWNRQGETFILHSHIHCSRGSFVWTCQNSNLAASFVAGGQRVSYSVHFYSFEFTPLPSEVAAKRWEDKKADHPPPVFVSTKSYEVGSHHRVAKSDKRKMIRLLLRR